MPTKRKKVSSKKQTNPSLKLVLNRLNQIDRSLKKLEKNTAAEFKSVRGEIAQGRQETAAEFKAVRSEMAQGFDSMQQKMDHVSEGAYHHYLRIENERKADVAEFRENQRQLLMSHENAAKNYEQFSRDRVILDAEIKDLHRAVETLKKRDMEKAAAIDKIEKEIDKLKAA